MKFDRDFAWALTQRGGQLAVGYVFFLVLARLLGPQEFGILSLALVWLGFFRVVGDVGLSSAVIQRETITSNQLSSVFFLNLGLAVGLALLGVMSVWLVNPVPDVTELPLVVSILSMTLILSGMSITQQALAYRKMRFRFLALRDFWAALIGGAVGVTAALLGWGVWALVLQTVVSSLVTAAFLWHAPGWSPRLSEFSLGELKPLLGFGLWILAFQVFGYAVREIDKLMIGAIAGVTVLGYYGLAIKLIFQPVVHFSGALGDYLFPKMSSMQKVVADIRLVYLASLSLAMAKAFPVLLTVGLFVHFYATSLLGAQWAGAVQLVPYVMLSAACQCVISPAGPVLKATNRPAWLLGWGIAFTSLVVGGAVLGLQHGIVQGAAGIAAAYLLGVVLVSLLMRKLLGIELRQLWLILSVLVLGGVCGGLGYAIVTGLPEGYKWLAPLVICVAGLMYWRTIHLFKQVDYTHFVSKA